MDPPTIIIVIILQLCKFKSRFFQIEIRHIMSKLSVFYYYMYRYGMEKNILGKKTAKSVESYS